MSVNEYRELLSDSFDSRYLDGGDGFIFSTEALKSGLGTIEYETMDTELKIWKSEQLLDPENLDLDEVVYALRKMQVIANILKRCLDEFRPVKMRK